MIVDGHDADGTGTFFLNQLGADVSPEDGGYRPGDDIPLKGKIYEQRDVTPRALQKTGVPATFKLRVSTPTATRSARPASSPPPTTARSTPRCPARSRRPEADARHELPRDAAHRGSSTRPPTAAGPPTASPPAPRPSPPCPTSPCSRTRSCPRWAGSSPATTTRSRVRVKNFKATPVAARTVTITVARRHDAVASPHLGRRHDPGRDRRRPRRQGARLRGHGGHARPGPADRLEGPLQPRDAHLHGGGAVESRSHGPKVIPPQGGYETSRYGDRPFPVVPVDYSDRSHERRTRPPASSRARSTTRRTPARRSTSTRRCPTASCSRTAPCPPRASPPRTGATSPGFDVHQERRRAPTPATASPTRRCPATPTSSSSPSGSRTAGTSCPARPTTTATTPTARRSSARWPASARCRRSTPAAARPARPSTTPPRSPTRRSTTTTTTPTRTASSTSS